MTVDTARPQRPTLARLMQAVPPRLRRPGAVMLISGAGIAAGLALGWEGLAAIGAAPILVGLLPCLAMCALGLCMRGGSSTCTARGAADTAPATTPRAAPSPDA